MFSSILVLLHPTLGYSEIRFYFEYTLRSLRYMRVGLLSDRINKKLEKSNLIDEHALIRGPAKSDQHQFSPNNNRDKKKYLRKGKLNEKKFMHVNIHAMA